MLTLITDKHKYKNQFLLPLFHYLKSSLFIRIFSREDSTGDRELHQNSMHEFYLQFSPRVMITDSILFVSRFEVIISESMIRIISGLADSLENRFDVDE